MTEMDILDFFYDRLRAEGHTIDTLFLSLDEDFAAKLQLKIKEDVPLWELHYYADICIANEWLERTTADPGYRYLSLTEVGLQLAVSYEYQVRERE